MAKEVNEVNVNELISNLKGRKVSPVNIILGEEQYQIQRVRQAYIDLIPEEEREFNVGQYDMETVPLSTALDDAMSVPFFGEYRLVMITNPYFLTGENKKSKIEHDLNGLINYIKNPQSTTILVIIAPYPKLDERKKIVKLLKQNGNMVDNHLMTEREVRTELTHVLKQKKFEIEPQALQLLLEKTGSKIEIAVNELQKLMIAAGKERLITVKYVEQLVSASLEQNVFDLIELVMQHNGAAALKMYHELLDQQEEPLKINAILLGNFRLLLQVKILHKHGYAQGNIAGTLRVHPYRVKLALRKIKHFSLGDLRKAYLGLLENEEKMKSTSQAPELLFQMFLLRFNQNKKAGN